MKSLYQETQREIGESGWLLSGPWIDALEESSLDEAIEHCQTCCEIVCKKYSQSNYQDLANDIEFLKSILADLEYDDKHEIWQQEIKKRITFLHIKEAA